MLRGEGRCHAQPLLLLPQTAQRNHCCWPVQRLTIATAAVTATDQRDDHHHRRGTGGNLGPAASSRPPPETALARFSVRLMSATSVRRACDDIRKFARTYL